jgi:Mycothiol maleylpyruvate isomerase N-terminal domain
VRDHVVVRIGPAGRVDTPEMTRTESDLTPAPDHADVDEVGEFIATLLATPPHRLTACRGWTAHELVAHLAAGAAEEADIIEAHFAGVARPTRGFEEREPPYRALPDDDLRDRLVEEAARLSVGLEQLARVEDDRVVFTGREMSAADLAMHSRSECSLHRWDLVGRDDVGWAMLSQAALTTHAVGVLSAMSTLAEAPVNRVHADGRDVRVILRSAPHDDVVVTIADATLTLGLQPISETAPDVELDAAARLLLLWGRREASARIDLHATGPAAQVLGALFGW